MEKLSLIVLADDDIIANQLHKMIIEEMELATRVEIVSDGENALELIKNYYSENAVSGGDVLLMMDLNMPGMDAFDFLDALGKDLFNLKNMHTVLISSYMSPKDKEKAQKYPLLDIISKPLTRERLYKLAEDVYARKIMT